MARSPYYGRFQTPKAPPVTRHDQPIVYALTAWQRGWWDGWIGKRCPASATAEFRRGWTTGRADRAVSDALPDPDDVTEAKEGGGGG